MLIRQTAPVFGAAREPLAAQGTWQVSLAYRGLKSDVHYSGSERQHHRERLGTYVINEQQALDLGISYAISDRFSLTFGIPFIEASWAVPTPIATVPPGPRAEQVGEGFGDLSLTGRYWLLPAQSARNVSLGLGVKAPTGDHRATGFYPDINGTNRAEKALDQSVQPGDGGWGVLVDLQAFWRFEQVGLFASGTYLLNPRDTNGTPSILAGLGFSSNPAFQAEGTLVNSVPDQYLLRLGAGIPVADSNVAASLAYRVEGLPRYDLIGDSHGWRRPGYEMFVEPGLSYSRGPAMWTLNVPVGFYRNRQPNPYSGREGDATFPDFIVLVGFTYQF